MPADSTEYVQPLILTIDGPAGTGKSTVAHLLAERLGLEYLDTGAMYRAAAVIAIEQGIDPADGANLAPAVEAAQMRFDWKRDPPPLMLGRRDISDRIRDLDVSSIVSIVAAQGEIRRVLVRRQQRIGAEHPRLVTEGRDQGSVVFPDASLRFYLDADVAVRAERRVKQLAAAGKPADLDEITENIRSRDHIDSTRQDGPLTCPDGAIVIDTNEKTAAEVVDLMEQMVRDRIAEAACDIGDDRVPGSGGCRWWETSRRAPGRSPVVLLFAWTFCRFLTWIVYKLLYRVRLRGAENVPRTGPVIYASNHQSHLDPMAVGLVIWDRPFASMARSSLFKFKPFGWFIQFFGAIPLQRGRGDSAAFKAALGELKAGRCVLLFPEGTRSRDGALGEFKAGVALLQKRTTAVILPLAVEGAHDIWPHGQAGPRLRGFISAKAGRPIHPDLLEREGADAVMDKLKRDIEALRLELRKELREVTGGKYPAPGPGDMPFWERGQVE